MPGKAGGQGPDWWAEEDSPQRSVRGVPPSRTSPRNANRCERCCISDRWSPTETCAPTRTPKPRGDEGAARSPSSLVPESLRGRLVLPAQGRGQHAGAVVQNSPQRVVQNRAAPENRGAQPNVAAPLLVVRVGSAGRTVQLRPTPPAAPTLQSARSPAHVALSPPPPSGDWYYRDPQGMEQGPVTASKLVGWRGGGFVPRDLAVRRKGGVWTPLHEALAPPPVASPPPPAPTMAQARTPAAPARATPSAAAIVPTPPTRAPAPRPSPASSPRVPRSSGDAAARPETPPQPPQPADAVRVVPSPKPLLPAPTPAAPAPAAVPAASSAESCVADAATLTSPPAAPLVSLPAQEVEQLAADPPSECADGQAETADDSGWTAPEVEAARQLFGAHAAPLSPAQMLIADSARAWLTQHRLFGCTRTRLVTCRVPTLVPSCSTGLRWDSCTTRSCR